MDLLGYLVVGLIAGAVSGWFVGIRAVQGFVPTLAVGMVGGVLGGWLASLLGANPQRSLMGAAIVAILGAIVVRVALRVLVRRR